MSDYEISEGQSIAANLAAGDIIPSESVEMVASTIDAALARHRTQVVNLAQALRMAKQQMEFHRTRKGKPWDAEFLDQEINSALAASGTSP